MDKPTYDPPNKVWTFTHQTVTFSIIYMFRTEEGAINKWASLTKI